ncbi:MAG TPA: hypothetical protein PKY81_05680 [bacterium]|nr:hypothetical protein [bacterium]HPN30428.1 hypothetical protein [bacterium]
MKTYSIIFIILSLFILSPSTIFAAEKKTVNLSSISSIDTGTFSFNKSGSNVSNGKSDLNNTYGQNLNNNNYEKKLNSDFKDVIENLKRIHDKKNASIDDSKITYLGSKGLDRSKENFDLLLLWK